MSSTESHRVNAGERLDLYIESARRQFDAKSIEDAARRLCDRLPPTGTAGRPPFGSWLKGVFDRGVSFRSFARTAAILVVAISFAAVFVPQIGGTALAQAQQWFTTFQTLRVEATVVEGGTVTEVSTWFDESGATRIESGGSTTVIQPAAGMIYVLRPDGGSFSQRIAPGTALVDSSVGFMRLVQTFVNADRLAETRVINGISAIGYRREADEWTMVLWMDPSDGRPLLVEQENISGVTIRSALSFNVPLPADAFDVPDDVRLLESR